MKIRFLDTCPSERPDVPFVAGQIITVDEPSLFLRGLVVAGHAVILDEEERAVEPNPEQPEPVRVKGPNRRAKH